MPIPEYRAKAALPRIVFRQVLAVSGLVVIPVPPMLPPKPVDPIPLHLGFVIVSAEVQARLDAERVVPVNCVGVVEVDVGAHIANAHQKRLRGKKERQTQYSSYLLTILQIPM